MWKWLHPYAKAEATYRLAGKFKPWFMIGGGLALLLGTFWGLVYAPADYQQGDAFRIIYMHVPSAILSMSFYAGMAICAFIGLVWQIRTCYMAVASIAPVGACLTFIALWTGAAWGKPMWGTWWVWDARLTSELILLFLYFGVMALYASFEDKLQGGKAASVMALVGVVNLPVIHYSVEWWNTLHQGATITKFAKPSMATEMLWPLLINIVALAVFCAGIVCLRLQNEIFVREIKRPWVIAMVNNASDKEVGNAV